MLFHQSEEFIKLEIFAVIVFKLMRILVPGKSTADFTLFLSLFFEGRKNSQLEC